MQRWEGRVALVSEASSGIGAAIAERLVKEGMIVVGFARRGERIEALSKELSGHKGKLHAFIGDLQKEEDIKAVFAWIENHLKSPVHVLVNNAAFTPVDTLLIGTAENWRQEMEVNVVGLSICTREAVRSMRALGFDEGHIININRSCDVCLQYYRTQRRYVRATNVNGDAKFAVTALTEALRKQLSARKSKIRVTNISVEGVRTEVAASAQIPGVNMDEISLLLPSDIADAAVFVLSLRQQVLIPELKIVPDAGSVLWKPIEKMLGGLH